MTRIVCPQCATVTDVVDVRRSADGFCASCDYPLFWEPDAVPQSVDGTASAPGRLPGVSGRAHVSSRPCWSCQEPNPLWETVCGRCGVGLDPPPTPIEPLEPPFPLDDVEPLPAAPESGRPVHAPPAISMWNPLSAGLAGLAAILAVVLTLVAFL